MSNRVSEKRDARLLVFMIGLKDGIEEAYVDEEFPPSLAFPLNLFSNK